MYSIMGDGIMNQFVSEEAEPASVYVENEPASLKEAMGSLSFQLLSGEDKTSEELKQEVQEKTQDLYVVFPEEF